MADKKDFSDLAKKIDIGGIVNNLKSLVNPEGKTPDVDPDDALGVKIASLSMKVQEASKKQKELSKELDDINHLLNGVFSDVQALRDASNTKKPTKDKAPCGSESSTSESADEDSTKSKESIKESIKAG